MTRGKKKDPPIAIRDGDESEGGRSVVDLIFNHPWTWAVLYSGDEYAPDIFSRTSANRHVSFSFEKNGVPKYWAANANSTLYLCTTQTQAHALVQALFEEALGSDVLEYPYLQDLRDMVDAWRESHPYLMVPSKVSETLYNAATLENKKVEDWILSQMQKLNAELAYYEKKLAELRKKLPSTENQSVKPAPEKKASTKRPKRK